MRSNFGRLHFGRLGAALAIAIGLVTGAAQASAQTNVTGMWDVTVVTDLGEGTLTLELTQAGDSISGTYVSPLFGTSQAAGRVTGNQVTIRVPVTDQSGALGISGTIVFSGTAQSPTSVTGSYDLAAQLVGTFTATKRAPGAPTPAAPATPPGG